MAPMLTPKRKAVAGPSTRETRKAKTEVKVKAEVVYLSQGLLPRIPPIESCKKALRANLKMMGCENLLSLPWSWTSDKMLEEICTRVSPKEFEGTIRANPGRWSKSKIAEALQIEGKGE
jgi:hypothetical protein